MTPDVVGPEPVEGETPRSRTDASPAADAALYELIAPDLSAREAAVRTAEPSLPDPDVLDRALRHALAHFRHEAGQQTLEYLRWRTEQTNADAVATVTASVRARQARAAIRAAVVAPDAALLRGPADAERPLGVADDRPRTFRDAVGCAWSVHEVAAGEVPWAHGPRCLLFGAETAIRRVWHYPPDWRSLSDAEPEALSWGV
jgi:hypothetical protein